MLIEIVDNIDVGEAYSYLQAENTGAVNLFIGTVRNHTGGKEVIKLEFEAYEPMAIKELQRIATQAKERWPIEKLLIQHVTGSKKAGEPVVIIGVSCPHRADSFEACRFLIDELKQTVPIWKKEYYADDSIWVNAHP